MSEEVVGNKRKRDNLVSNNEDLDNLDYIDNIVKEIYYSKISNKEKKSFYEKKYSNFAQKYPSIFAMSISDDFDMNRFEYMMKLKKSVNNEKLSQHDASVKVGKMLYDVYVKDNIPK